MKIAVYPGSFDPITNGHIDVIQRCSTVFDKVIVAVLNNSAKHCMFTAEERVRLINKACRFENVSAMAFDGLLVDFMKQFESAVIVKGLRTVKDFEYEFQMSLLNKSLSGNEAETFFLMTGEKYSYISSSMVKEVFTFGGSIKDFVPSCVESAMAEKTENGGNK